MSNFALISADGKSGMLKMWIDGMKRSKVTNFMVICIDDQVAETMKKLGVAYWRKDPKKTADGSASNHGISALKFQLIKEFLLLGHSVTLMRCCCCSSLLPSSRESSSSVTRRLCSRAG